MLLTTLAHTSPLVCAHFQELEMYADKLRDLICNLMTSQEELPDVHVPSPGKDLPSPMEDIFLQYAWLCSKALMLG